MRKMNIYLTFKHCVLTAKTPQKDRKFTANGLTKYIMKFTAIYLFIQY